MTNIRHAKDILMFGKSLPELGETLELLTELVQEYGLGLNPAKTKIMTWPSAPDATTFVDTTNGFVENICASSRHPQIFEVVLFR